jgi:hypothetical protein
VSIIKLNYQNDNNQILLKKKIGELEQELRKENYLRFRLGRRNKREVRMFIEL